MFPDLVRNAPFVDMYGRFWQIGRVPDFGSIPPNIIS